MENAPQIPPVSPKKTISLFLVFILIAAGFIGAFGGGYILNDLLQAEKPTQLVPKPSPGISPSPGVTIVPATESETTLFIPGKTYFDDTLIAVTSEAPHYTVVISARRSEQENGFIQSTGFSFFDGSDWKRELATTTSETSQIITNKLIRKWEIAVDPSRVLKESAQATFAITNHVITVQTNELYNEIAMRSLPGYTKFMSDGAGSVSIDGKSYNAHILYTRIFSLNAKDIQFYTAPVGLETYWIAFWDNEGNFYHIDKTSVSKPTDIYKTHEIAVEKDNRGAVTKSFTVEIQPDKTVPPNTLSIQTNLLTQASLSLKKLNTLNKAPNNSYTWTMSQIEGEVVRNNQSIKGFGLFEYIKD